MIINLDKVADWATKTTKDLAHDIHRKFTSLGVMWRDAKVANDR